MFALGVFTCILIQTTAVPTESSRSSRQVASKPVEGFPNGLPALTPLGVRLTIENMIGPDGDKIMLESLLIQDLTVRHSTCVNPTESPPLSCVPLEPYLISSTSCVTGGITLTVPSSPTSTF